MRKLASVLLFVIVSCVPSIARAQIVSTPPAPQPAPKYIPSEVQLLRLRLAQQIAINAQATLNASCGTVNPNGTVNTTGELKFQFQSALDSLSAEAAKVRKENAWPDTVAFDQSGLVFFDAPKDTTRAVAAPEAVKKPVEVPTPKSGVPVEIPNAGTNAATKP